MILLSIFTVQRLLKFLSALTILLTFWQDPAFANSWTVRGFDGRALANGGASVARATGAAAVYDNPAGMSSLEASEAKFTYYLGLPKMSLSYDNNSNLQQIADMKELDSAIICSAIDDPQDQETCMDSVEQFNKYPIAARNQITVNEELRKVAIKPPNSNAVMVAAAIPVTSVVQKMHIVVGTAVYLPINPLLYQRIKNDSVPFFLDYDDALHVPAIAASISASPVKNLQVGVGVNLLVSVNAAVDPTLVLPPHLTMTLLGPESLVSVNTDDIRLVIDGNLKARMTATPIAGIRYAPTDWLTLGVAFRDKTLVDVNAKGELRTYSTLNEKPSVVPIALSSVMAYSPRELAAGVMLKPAKFISFSADLLWQQWEHYRAPTDVKISISDLGGTAEDVCRSLAGLESLLQLAGTFAEDFSIDPCELAVESLPDEISLNGAPFAQAFENIFSPRLGVEVTPTEGFNLALGYSFEPSPTPPQSGLHNILDSDTHVFGSGLFYQWSSYQIGVFAQWRKLSSQRTSKCLNELLPGCSLNKDSIRRASAQQTFPNEAVLNEIANPDDDANIAAANADIQNLNQTLENSPIALPGYPAFTIGGSYWSTGLELSVAF